MKAVLLKAIGALLFLTALAMWLSRAPDWPVDALVARWAPPPSDFIEVKGQLLHLRDEGPRDDPEPLVLLHGTSASLHTWEGWVAALRTQHRVISLDLPGFGLTGPSAAGDYRGDTYARFVLDVMDHLGMQRFAIAGNSLGGEVAWRTALMAPQRVSKLILVDAAGPDFKSDSVPIGFIAARVPVLNRAIDWVLPRAMVVSSLHDVYGDPSKVNDALVDRYYQLTLREGNRRALVQRLQQNRARARRRAHRRVEAADADRVGRARPADTGVGGQAVPDRHQGQRVGGLRRVGARTAGGRSGAHGGGGEELSRARLTAGAWPPSG